MKLKINDKVASKEHPEIKSKIKKIKRSYYFPDEILYYLENNCVYTRDEIIKI